MAGFVFERDLPHQNAAVSGVMRALDGLTVEPTKDGTRNPRLVLEGMAQSLQANILSLRRQGEWQQNFKIDTNNLSELILDISMETGTGKTYAYTKTMLELNKQTGISKFIVAVPRVAIKAGTVSFLKSPAAKEHFREEFDRDIRVYEVQSQKARKGKKEHMPQAIADFCRADSGMNKRAIHVLVINSGMINSKTMEKAFDVALFDEFNVPFEAVANTRPLLIIDEPHTFKRGNTTFQKLMRFEPQLTLRYGATFDGDLINLVYELSAVEAFNQDLVKGITVHLEKFEEGENVALRFVDSDGKEATFELNESGKKSTKKIVKGESFEGLHPQMTDLTVEKLNKSTVVLSNGLELKKSDRINPFSYAETLQEKMIRSAIVTHFEIEQKLLLAQPRIKPLSLFFIDNIESYRDQNGALRDLFESLLETHLKKLISEETDTNFKQHLEAALSDVSALHGGYFSKDNSDSDEKIEQETLEILHQKEALLDLQNPRRFVFSKWTLREGWDNPNVFLICKLRSSGSETSKLQEVGRGLRLPVNEFMGRDRSSAHELHYFVDFTETEFTQKLTQEINSKSNVAFNEEKLETALKERLLEAYAEFENEEDTLLTKLVTAGIVTISHKFTDGGYAALKNAYPLAFKNGLKKGKVKNAGPQKAKATIRAGKYAELKELWERISEKAVLEYKINGEAQFRSLFLAYMKSAKADFAAAGSVSTVQRLSIADSEARFDEEVSLEAEVLPFVMMNYTTFVRSVSEAVALRSATVHSVFMGLGNEGFQIEEYMNAATIRKLRQGFNDYLMRHAFGKFEVGFKKTKNSVHPTKFTNSQGGALEAINSSDVGVFHEDGLPPENYLLDQIFYDGNLELENIKTNIAEVIVYSKLPKNSIRIPLVGGGTYSPDFAYVVKTQDGKSKLNLIVETKGKDDIDLGEREAQKIKHAERYFNDNGSEAKVMFKRQLKADKMVDLIKEFL